MTRRIKHPTARNPIALAVARAQARKAFDALKTDAGLHPPTHHKKAHP